MSSRMLGAIIRKAPIRILTAVAFTDVMAGHVPLFAGNIINALPHIKSGEVRAYGMTSARRARAAQVGEGHQGRRD